LKKKKTLCFFVSSWRQHTLSPVVISLTHAITYHIIDILGLFISLSLSSCHRLGWIDQCDLVFFKVLSKETQNVLSSLFYSNHPPSCRLGNGSILRLDTGHTNAQIKQKEKKKICWKYKWISFWSFFKRGNTLCFFFNPLSFTRLLAARLNVASFMVTMCHRYPPMCVFGQQNDRRVRLD
jgi:hypothetical protein